MHRAAVFSPNGEYRYRLVRRWDSRPVMVWVMLNPSTADDQVDDPTIVRCIDFAQRWGHGGLVVYNLFALRATDPRVLSSHPDPVGPDNASWLRDATQPSNFPPFLVPPVVAAWGAHKAARQLLTGDLTLYPHQAAMRRVVRDLRTRCLGVTKDGSPRHPLYMRATAKPITWPPVQIEAT